MTVRTRIILVFIIVVSGGFFLLVNWITDDLRPRYLESLEEPLVDTAHILAELVAAELDHEGQPSSALRDVFTRVYARRFEAQVYALRKDAVDVRIYVTDRDGIVVFDSDNGRDEGQDYSQWNDVFLTLRGQYGARSSHDRPLYPEISVKYVAAPILEDGAITGVVTVGKPARNVNQFIAAAKSKFYTAGIVAAFVALMLAVILYRWVSRPLDRLVEYAERVKAGERVSLPDLGNNEMGMMGAAIEDMRNVLEGKDYAEQYVQTLTHELKSPLAAIRAAAELLDEAMPEEERRRFIGNIRSEVSRIQHLIDRMLALAALERQQALESTEVIVLSKLIDEVVEDLGPQLSAKALRIDNQVPGQSSIVGDPFLLRQAIENLLRNALAFSPENELVTVCLEMSPDAIDLSFADHGPGLPDYAYEKVFDRFYSLPPPGETNKSTGLGLGFVREIAALHGGTATLETHRDGGAIATLRLPRGYDQGLA